MSLSFLDRVTDELAGDDNGEDGGGVGEGGDGVGEGGATNVDRVAALESFSAQMHVFAETAVEGGAAQGLGRRMLSTSSMSSLVHSRSLPSLSLLGATGVNTHNVIVKAWREGRKRTATCLAASFARYLVVPGGLAVDASRARAVCKEAAGVPLLSLGGALGRTTDYRDVEGLPAEYVFVASTSMALVAVGGSRPLVEVAEALSLSVATDPRVRSEGLGPRGMVEDLGAWRDGTHAARA